MRYYRLMLGIVGCIAAPIAYAQDRGIATATGDTQSHVAVAKPQKPLSPIGRAMADLLRAAAQTPAVAAPKAVDAAKATPGTGQAASGDVAATSSVQVDQVAVH